MLTIGKLIEHALGPDEASMVDTAIPQGAFDAMGVAARSQIAGWYYAPEAKLMGRLLTKEECWQRILFRLGYGGLKAMMAAMDVTHLVPEWGCFRFHVEQGHIQLEEQV